MTARADELSDPQDNRAAGSISVTRRSRRLKFLSSYVRWWPTADWRHPKPTGGFPTR